MGSTSDDMGVKYSVRGEGQKLVSRSRELGLGTHARGLLEISDTTTTLSSTVCTADLVVVYNFIITSLSANAVVSTTLRCPAVMMNPGS